MAGITPSENAFPIAEGSMTAAVDFVAAEVAQMGEWADNGGVAAGTATIAAAALINASYRITSGSTATLTTDTAANIVAALDGAQVGSAFEFLLVNGGSGTATLSGGTGVTIVGNAAPTTGKNQLFKGVVTAVGASPAVSLIAISSAYL